jgi:Tfp pilus assembly protein PilF
MIKIVPLLVLSVFFVGCVRKSEYDALQEHDQAVQQQLSLATAQLSSLQKDLNNANVEKEKLQSQISQEHPNEWPPLTEDQIALDKGIGLL